MDLTVGWRYVKKVCKYCKTEFVADRYNHHKHESCRSTACLAKANCERQRRLREKRKLNKKEDEAFRMKEAQRQRQRRLKVKDFSPEHNPLQEFSFNTVATSSVLLGLLSHVMDCEDAFDLSGQLRQMSSSGRRLINQKTPYF